MSFIGTLDQFNLSIILQKIEEYRKTGLLIARQGESAVELFVRQGQLICIGPVKPGISLGERLVQVGELSREACQSVESSLGELRFSENDAARAFVRAGCLKQEGLIRWALAEATQVLEAVLAWEDGELYFQEDQLPPVLRLPVPLSVASLLPAASAANLEPSAFLSTYPLETDSGPFDRGERNTDEWSHDTVSAFQSRQRVTDPIPPVRVNSSYIQPNMVLVSADLSAYRENNPQVVLTPEQWRLFTRANGETTLFMAAQELGMAPEQVCRAAAELQSLGLVAIFVQGAPIAVFDSDQNMGDNAGIVGHYGLKRDDALAAYAQNGAVIASAHSYAMAFSSMRQPVETQSQWGNGGNGARFQLGSGWVVSPASPQFNQHARKGDEPSEHNKVFANAS